MDFHSLTRRELQTLCKKNGIPANITNLAMADSLKALQTTVQGIEDLSNCSQPLTAQSGVESPERSGVTSSRVPRTRSVRKTVENDTLVNQTQSRTRRTTRNLNSGFAADEKDSIAPINIDVQFSEVQNQIKKISTSKEAGIPQTPSVVSNTRKRVGKGETTAKSYGTRRSTRLAVKTQGDTSDAANMKLFSADGGDNYEMGVQESYTDLSEDVQSTVSHSEVVSETSKCEEMPSNYSGVVEIQNDLGSGCDSTMDCGKIIEMVLTEVDEGNKGDDFHEQPEVENNDVVIGEKGDDFHEQSKVENNDEAIGGNGDDFYEEPEVEMKNEVTAENVDGVTKQPDTEIVAEVAAESLDLSGENDELIDNGEVVTGEVMNCLTDNDDILAEAKDHDAGNLVPEVNDLTLGDNGDMIVEAEGHVAGDTLVGDMIVETGHALFVEEQESEESDADLVTESEEEEADLVTIAAEKQLDNGDCDTIVGVGEFVANKSEEEKADVDTIVAEEQLVKPDCDKPSQEILGEEDASKDHIDSQMIVDGGIVLPAADNPKVLVGKENSDEYSSVAKEDNKQMKERDPTDMSIRQIKKELKKLSLNNKKGNSGEFPRPALKTLTENHQF